MYGVEYFYGDGIATGYPANTPYGKPIRKEDMGETQKSQSEIMTWVTSQATAFSGATYNPLAHNCNHFSDAMTTFLTGHGIPSEILSQPDELLSTPIGKTIANLFGFSAAPLEYKKEEIDPELASLYIDEPKIFLGEDDELVQAIQNMHLSAQFSHQLNKVLNAVNDKKDFEADKAVLAEMKASEKNEDLFNLLALLCATSSYDNIPEELLPHNLFESQSKTSDAFLRYVNNYLAETNGMREARLKAVLYAGFIRNAMEDEKVVLMACRCYYQFSRTQTLQNIKQITPIPHLVTVYQQYV